jgi:hypothetical protein
MTAQSKSVVKSYFETGDKPTAGQFADLVDSYEDYGTSAAGVSAHDSSGSAHSGLVPTAQNQLIAWMAGGVYRSVSSGSYSGTYTDALVSANVTWMDGSAGAYSSGSINSTHGKVVSFSVTHVNSGVTFTQPAMTLDINGNPVTVPAITVA